MARKTYGKIEKARIALEAIKGQKTIAELSSEYGVHSSQINAWKKQLIDGASEIFSKKADNSERDHTVERDRLYQKVGQLQVEVDWLKKSCRVGEMSLADKRSAIDPTQKKLSISRQCSLLALHRSSYYRPALVQVENAWNQQLMRLIDEEYFGLVVLFNYKLVHCPKVVILEVVKINQLHLQTN